MIIRHTSSCSHWLKFIYTQCCHDVILHVPAVGSRMIVLGDGGYCGMGQPRWLMSCWPLPFIWMIWLVTSFWWPIRSFIWKSKVNSSWAILVNPYRGNHRRQVRLIILGDAGYHGMGYITLTKMAHQLLTLSFHLNVLIGHQKGDEFWKRTVTQSDHLK